MSQNNSENENKQATGLSWVGIEFERSNDKTFFLYYALFWLLQIYFRKTIISSIQIKKENTRS